MVVDRRSLLVINEGHKERYPLTERDGLPMYQYQENGLVNQVLVVDEID